MEILPILIKSSTALSAFLLVYYLLLHKSSHFNINRAFLFIGLVTTLTISLVDITYPVYVVMQVPGYVESPGPSMDEINTTFTQESLVVKKPLDWSSILFWTYSMISAIFILRLTLSVIHGIRLVYSAKKMNWGNTFLYIHPSVKNPMVFGHKIFVKDESYLQAEKLQILIHEQIHKDQNHWVDMLASELLLAFVWFNPLAFIYRKAIVNNLEYIADRGVLNTGLQLNTYIQSILCETMGAETIVLANHFRTSQNKQRLKMMKNVKQSKWGKFKLLLIFPVIGGLCWAFSEPEYIPKENVQQQNNTVVRNEIFKGRAILEDTMKIRMQDGTYMTQIVHRDVSDINVVIKGSNIGTFTDKGGNFEIKVKKGDVLVFSHVAFETKEIKYTGQQEVFVLMENATYQMLIAGKYRDKYFGKPNTNLKLKVVKPNSSLSKDGDGFVAIEIVPEYKFGLETYFAQLYSKSAQLAKSEVIKGDVNVVFGIGEDGSLKIINTFGNEDSKVISAATQVVRDLNDWYPAMQRGKKMPYKYCVKVEF